MLTGIASILIYLPFRIGRGFLLGVLMIRLWSRALGKEIGVRLDDAALELLLRFMGLWCRFHVEYRQRHLKDFRGTYLFKTRDGRVDASFTFKNDDMTVSGEASTDWDVAVVFKNARALRSALKDILLRGRMDILDLMLENKLEIQGNINLLFKFLYMVSDLRAGLPFPTV